MFLLVVFASVQLVVASKLIAIQLRPLIEIQLIWHCLQTVLVRLLHSVE